MFRKPAQSEAVPDVAPPAEPVVVPDAPLDVLAAILRALGEHATTNRPTAAGELETWARHVLLLVPPPSRSAMPAQVDHERDWNGLRHFVIGHIRDECAASSAAVGDLRDALWVVIERMSTAVLADAKDDRRAAACLERLRDAAASSTDELKKAALETAAELGELIQSKAARHRDLARALGERVNLLRYELDEARREAELDGLTQLGNRSVLERELERSAQLFALTGEPYALVIIDVDGFKVVNDTFGHVAGDNALRAISDALAFSFPRRSDVVCRYGGDEFAVILRDAALPDAERLAMRFVETVRRLEIESADARIRVTVSVGVAEVDELDDASGWLKRADQALYQAKQAGRDRVRAASPPADDGSGERQAA